MSNVAHVSVDPSTSKALCVAPAEVKNRSEEAKKRREEETGGEEEEERRKR